jgi:hypothetical protein
MATIVPATIKFSEFAEQTAEQDDIFVGLKSGANAQFTYAAAPSDATFILQTADADLTNAQAIGDLSSGLLVGTTTTGVILSRTLTGTSNEIDVANGDGISGNPTVGISDNPVIPGTAGISIPAGTTGERVVPSSPNINLRWNTTINAVEYYDHGSTAWEQLAESLPDGPDTSVQYNSGGAFAGSTNFTFDGSQVAITGDLQVDNININGNTITSTDAAGNINLTPDTTGDLVLDGLKWPQADGSAGQTLITNGAAQLSWSSAGSVTVPTVDQTVARFNGTTGALEDSGVTINDSDVMSGITQLNVDNLRVDGNTIESTSGALNLTGATDVNITSSSGNINLTAGSGNIVAADNFIAGDPGTESSGIDINGTTYDSVFKVSDIGGSNAALSIFHRHSTTLQPLLIGAHSNSDTSAHGTVTSGQSMFTVYGAGWTGSHYDLFGAIDISADTSGTISATSSPGRIRFQVTPDASNTPVTALTISNNANVTFSNNAIFATTKGILDGNSNEQLLFTQTASAVNYLNITNAATSGNPVLEATGSDSNVSLKLNGKGTGSVLMGSATTSQPFSSLLAGDVVIVSDTNSDPLLVKTNSAGANQCAGVFHQSSASPSFDAFRAQSVGTSSSQAIANFLSGVTDATGVGGISRLYIRQDGKIGINNSSPAYPLDVTGSSAAYMARFSDSVSSGTALAAFRNTAAVSTSNAIGLEFRLNSSTAERQSGLISSQFTTTTDASRASKMDFKTTSAGAQVTPLSLVENDCYMNGDGTVIGELTVGEAGSSGVINSRINHPSITDYNSYTVFKRVANNAATNLIQITIPATTAFCTIRCELTITRAAVSSVGTSQFQVKNFSIGRNGSGSDVVLDALTTMDSTATSTTAGGAQNVTSGATTIVRNGAEANTDPQVVNITVNPATTSASSGICLARIHIAYCGSLTNFDIS